MVTRIRYSKTPADGVVQSVRNFDTTDGKTCAVFLNILQLTFHILTMNGGTQEMLASGSAVSVPKLKIRAKEALETLGISFADEKRPRGVALP